MATHAVTVETGATSTAGPMLTVPPDRVVTDDAVGTAAGDSGLNPVLLADLVQGSLAHERMGINLQRVLLAQTANPTMGPRLRELMDDTERCIEAYERLATELGINPQMATRGARMTEGLDQMVISSFLNLGSADPMTIELKGIEALFLSATMCVANTRSLELAADVAKPGRVQQALRTAVRDLLPRQLEHVRFAEETRSTMIRQQLEHATLQKAGNVVAGVVRTVKEKLHEP